MGVVVLVATPSLSVRSVVPMFPQAGRAGQAGKAARRLAEIVLDRPVDCPRLAWRNRSPGPELGIGGVEEPSDAGPEVGPRPMYPARERENGVPRKLAARLIEWGGGSPPL